MYDAVIVGGGVMGLATAYSLLKRGVKRVLVLEQHTVGHGRASSTDATKAIRYEYSEAEQYSLMVGRALELWRELEAASSTTLYVNSGIVCWGYGDAPYTRNSFRTLSRLGSPIRELTPNELCDLYPQFSVADVSYATYNPEGGFMRASACVQALAGVVRKIGGEIRENCRVTKLMTEGDIVTVAIENVDAVTSSRVVLAAGPWTVSLLPELGLDLPVTAHKQQVMYIEGLPDQFRPDRFPVFLNLDHDFYGFPLDENGLLKVSVHFPGPVVDPYLPHLPDTDVDTLLLALVEKYIPEAAKRTAKMSRVCMYDMTPDEDFILDLLPGHSNIAIASGFSGHGFKFGPLIGELLASLVMGNDAEFPMERFALSRFST